MSASNAEGRIRADLRRSRNSRGLPWLIVVLALEVLAVTIIFARLHLREQIRAQIAGRDAAVLQAVAASRLSDETTDELTVVLETSRLKGVMGVRLFDADGRFTKSFPATVRDAHDLATADNERLAALLPVTRYYAAAQLNDIFLSANSTAPLPVLDVLVPLHRQDDTALLGIAEFVLEGESLATEFAALDRHLTWQAVAAFAGGGVILVAALTWAFRRLQQSNRALAERTDSLLKANHELTLAAKTSAVGALTAHLIHGLKNPLSGLHNFVSSRTPTDDDWTTAAYTARQMQTLVGNVVRVLQEQDDNSRYELSLAELVEILSGKVSPLAQQAGVRWEPRIEAAGVLSNRDANLVLLILENLIHNAIQATPPGKLVSLAVRDGDGTVALDVRDEGPGFPEKLKAKLFTPCPSGKEGGSGIGLAISKQLANHLGARLDLTSSSSAGCVFSLRLPATLLGSPPG